MSAQNVEVVRRGLASFMRGDLDAAFEMLADEVRWEGVPGVEPCRTREEVENTIPRPEVSERVAICGRSSRAAVKLEVVCKVRRVGRSKIEQCVGSS
jgi:ketosteroid isomerase-like protein